MEVDDINIENNLLEDNYFKISYPKQNYKISLDYKQWKKSIEAKFGKNGKEIFCNKDNIIIYQQKEYINNFLKCPLCGKNIYQCQYCNKSKDSDTGRCCLKRYIKELKNNEKKYQFIKYKRKEDLNEFYEIFLVSFIPFIFATQFVLIFIYIFYFNIEDKNGLNIIDRIFEKERENKMMVFRIILLCYLFCINIPYSILFYSIYFIIAIISIPFKLMPIKMIFGIFYTIV